MAKITPRQKLTDEIAHFTVCTKCTMEEFAKDILDATGRTVDPNSDDLLATLTDDEVSRVHKRLRHQVAGTFARFKATRRDATAEELAEITAGSGVEITKALKYGPDECPIFIELTEGWETPPSRPGKYYLLLNRSEFISDDLELLERKLYDWTVDEGYWE